ncbi:MJ0042-type zinc finger domain-containing protein [Croceicoccus marinus]|uniref:Zinc finger/thioredoxin putative domain-containing protein n=1 Tax=Croceicoccus marinus TaxID=450378 RepID=A0A1Z1FD83_9SPHN|nr:MJ0042-type zinc finger domain-containing protein [Croceicoccus marinus]ARU16720.1 hypothetical protein A9D14_11695 [Croceicoccus marinus]
MHVTCDHCDSDYSVPSQLLGGEGRPLRCGECGSRWWQQGEQSTMLTRSGRRTLVVSSNGRYREEAHRFTSFFDGISNRFAAQPDDATALASQRFQRLRETRGQRRYRESTAIVEAEFKEIRDFAQMRDTMRVWLPRMIAIGLFASAMLVLLLAA